MTRRFLLAAFVVLLGAEQVVACSAKAWDPNELVENTPVYSSNGRFCVVVRWHEAVADFSSELAGRVFGIDDPNSSGDADRKSREPLKTVTAALYESTAKSRRLVAEIPLDADEDRQVLVSDSGRYLIAGPATGGCYARTAEGDALVTIYPVEGSSATTLTVGNVFTQSDTRQIAFDDVRMQFHLRHESQDREVVVLSFPLARQEGDEPRYGERRVDVATAALLDDKRDIFPAPRVYATSSARAPAPRRAYESPSPDCAGVYKDANLLRVASGRLFAQAIFGPLPQFPDIAWKVRIRGTVRVEVVVSERGDVLCTRNTPLPFGLSNAAVEAARRWKFKPAIVNGHPVKAVGEILFHFENIDEQTWRDALASSPPTDE